MPDPIRAFERAQRHPERETLELAAAGAAKVLGHDHSATRAFAQAAATMAKVDLWHARLALKTLRRDQREAIETTYTDARTGSNRKAKELLIAGGRGG